MRFRPRNHREDNPEIFAQLVKNNPYMALVYDYPELLLPHPTPENFQQLWSVKKRAVSDAHSVKSHVEIGCGSGRYLIELAKQNPQDLFLGLELRYKRLVFAAKKIKQQNISNILLMRERGEFIDEYLPLNSIDCLHINFPDPWSKKSRRKNRILSADFLNRMHPYFCSGAELRFKTDHLEYFETVTGILQELDNFKIVEHTTDLHRSDFNGNNILTEFELLFKSKGNPPIGYLSAKPLNK
ncbi:MAG: tRNA (guanosine(46)-N7)-methyltransferase TrmB [SAR324 cluster bacterium]|nr:tRNA (guanosine(46)-N7)-methyltransferase TrmB [SAR324 cluster bacterium]